MPERLYIKSDLAAMAGVKLQNLSRDLVLPEPDYVAGDPARYSYSEATVRAWCEANGFTFVSLSSDTIADE